MTVDAVEAVEISVLPATPCSLSLNKKEEDGLLCVVLSHCIGGVKPKRIVIFWLGFVNHTRFVVLAT